MLTRKKKKTRRQEQEDKNKNENESNNKAGGHERPANTLSTHVRQHALESKTSASYSSEQHTNKDSSTQAVKCKPCHRADICRTDKGLNNSSSNKMNLNLGVFVGAQVAH